MRVYSLTYLPHRLVQAVHDVGGEVKRASMYLRGMGETGVKFRSIVSSSFEHSRPTTGAMQGNASHQVVSAARCHTRTTAGIKKFQVVPMVYNIEIMYMWLSQKMGLKHTLLMSLQCLSVTQVTQQTQRCPVTCD